MGFHVLLPQARITPGSLHIIHLCSPLPQAMLRCSGPGRKVGPRTNVLVAGLLQYLFPELQQPQGSLQSCGGEGKSPTASSRERVRGVYSSREEKAGPPTRPIPLWALPLPCTTGHEPLVRQCLMESSDKYSSMFPIGQTVLVRPGQPKEQPVGTQ